MSSKEVYQIKTIKPIFHSHKNSSVVKYIVDMISDLHDAIITTTTRSGFIELVEDAIESLTQLNYDIENINESQVNEPYYITLGTSKREGDYMDFIYDGIETRYPMDGSNHEREIKRCTNVIGSLGLLTKAINNNEPFSTLVAKGRYVSQSILRLNKDGAIPAPQFNKGE